jgi:hypothetical protein
MIYRALIAGTLTALLSGCLTPNLHMATEQGGVLTRVAGPTRDEALRIAEAHCRQYGRVVRITQTDTLNSSITFQCVAPGS